MVNKNTKIKLDHPYLVIEEIISRYGNHIKFEFGQYIYYKNTLEDHREYILLNAEETNKGNIEKIIRSLKSDFELALHSRVHFKTNEVLHIPMIDFCGSLSPDDWGRVKKILPHKIVENLKIFESGSSYHGYSTELIPQEEWIKFMGTILILNAPDSEPIVDARWVGHRLRGGFGSLRWSCNTLQYIKIPNLVNINGNVSLR